MNEMVDLGRYVRAVIHRWPVVLSLALLGAVAGFLISRALPPVYEASTTLLITTPKLKADFDSRFRSTLDLGLNTSLNRTLFSLLKNREVEALVVLAMGDALLEEEQLPGNVIERISVTQVGGDTSYFQIKARHRQPQVAQSLAETWADVYAAQVNALYGFPVETEGDVEISLSAAEAKLGEAAAALEAFQAETGTGLVDNIQYPASFSRQSGLTDMRNLFGLYERYGAAGDALETKNLTLGGYLAARDMLSLLIEEGQRLEGQSTALGSSLPLELLGTSAVLSNRGRLDRVPLAGQDIDTVLAALRIEAEQLQGIIAALQKDVNSLQAELADRQRRLTELVRDRQLAEESYIILALKQQEITVQNQMQDSWLQVVSPALLPIVPVAPSALINTVVGGVLGGLLGVLAALLLMRRGESLMAARS